MEKVQRIEFFGMMMSSQKFFCTYLENINENAIPTLIDTESGRNV